MARPFRAKMEKIEIVAGDGLGFHDSFQVVNKTTRAPVDVTGWQFQAHLRADPSVKTVTRSFLCTVSDGPTGMVSMDMAPTEAQTLAEMRGAQVDFSYLNPAIGVPLPLGYAPAAVVWSAAWQG